MCSYFILHRQPVYGNKSRPQLDVTATPSCTSRRNRNGR